MSLLMNNFSHKALLKVTYLNMLRVCRLSANVTDISNFKPRDQVTDTLMSSPNVYKIMAVVKSNLPDLTPHHMITALSRLNDIQNTVRKKEFDVGIIKDPTFDTLCKNLEKHVETLNVSEIVKVVKILSNLKVPEDSNILQTLLQKIRLSINIINTEEIIKTDLSLSIYQGQTKLVDSLKFALPLAFQIRLPLELTNKSVHTLLYILNYCCNNVLPERCLNNAVTGILLHDRAKINARMAADITKMLCKMIHNNYNECVTRVRLVQLCCEIMAKNLSHLSNEIILRTVYSLKNGMQAQNPGYYNAEFMDQVADYAIQNNWDFNQCMNLVICLSKIVHTHTGLAEYICDKAVSNKDILTKASPDFLYNFIECLSRFNYKPDSEQWNEIQRQIRANVIYDLKSLRIPWSLFFLNVTSLNYYMEEEMQIIFSREYLDEYIPKRRSIFDCYRFLTLHAAVKTFHSDRSELPKYIVDNAKKLIEVSRTIDDQNDEGYDKYHWLIKNQYPLVSLAEPVARDLALGLGGPEYVTKNVELLNGFIADAIVCIKDTCLLKVTPPDAGSTVPIAELNLPQDTHVICIVSFKSRCYPKNSDLLCGSYQLIVDILEKHGYPTVALNAEKWTRLDDDEKTPYLMEQLKKKCHEHKMELWMFDTLSDILK